MDCKLPAPVFLSSTKQAKLRNIALCAGWRCLDGRELGEVSAEDVALVHLSANTAELRGQCSHALFVAEREAQQQGSELSALADLYIEDGLAPELIRQMFFLAEKYWRNQQKVGDLAREVGLRRQRMHQLSQISMSLTGQMSQRDTLHTILREACDIAGCEGGSLYLIETSPGQDESLVFKLAQNVRVQFPFVETRLPLTAESIAGYVATTGHTLNIRDVYALPANVPYRFNRFFDQRMNYRTRSVLAIPMRDHRDQLVGVLQFINQRDTDSGEVVPFNAETAEVLNAVASQAAVSLQKNALLEDINELFESFVQASVRTIEKRDPTTSGHSFRVAQTTVALLEALPKSSVPEFRNLAFSAEDIREVRYAALLHDFGKVSVPEATLLKANKLSEERMETLRFRFELQRERLRREALQEELHLLHHGSVDQEVARRRVHRNLAKKLATLDQYADWVERANTPNVLREGDFSHLNEISQYGFLELDGSVRGLIDRVDLEALSVRQGSLTTEERRLLEAHVGYTKEFLAALPWPPELAKVPDIAGAHHERLNGSGYPDGLVGNEIPLPSRVMAVCDVYDALTAMDRPYKPAMSHSKAFEILYDEARRGLLDPQMVDIFIASGSFEMAAAV